MKQAIIRLYAYLICFLTIVCGVVIIGAGVYNIIEITAPHQMLPENIRQDHQNNESFIHSHYKSNLYEYLTEMQITSQRQESLKEEIIGVRNNAVKGLMVILVLLLVDIGVFYIHRPILERPRM